MNISRIEPVSALIVALALTAVSGAQQTASDDGGIDPALGLAWERAGRRGRYSERTRSRPSA